MIPQRSSLDTLRPYIAGKSVQEVQSLYNLSRIIKLGSNENPLGCPLSLEQLSDAFDTIHQYPHQPSSGLIEALCRHHHLTQDLFILGNGSDEVLLFLALAYLDPKDEVVMSQCTFSEYTFVSRLMGSHLKKIPLSSTYTTDLTALFDAITTDTKMVFICNPNNPTGTYVTSEDLYQFLCKVPPSVLVVVDEAYAE